jgi:hypothetical protein
LWSADIPFQFNRQIRSQATARTCKVLGFHARLNLPTADANQSFNQFLNVGNVRSISAVSAARALRFPLEP